MRFSDYRLRNMIYKDKLAFKGQNREPSCLSMKSVIGTVFSEVKRVLQYSCPNNVFGFKQKLHSRVFKTFKLLHC